MNAIKNFARDYGQEEYGNAYGQNLESEFRSCVQSVIGDKGDVIDAWNDGGSEGYAEWHCSIKNVEGMAPDTEFMLTLVTDLEDGNSWLTCQYDTADCDVLGEADGHVGDFDPFPLIDKCLKQAGKSEARKPESCKDGKKESMERCDSCGAVMTEYDYDRYGGLCKRCRDKGEAKKPAESSKKNEKTADIGDTMYASKLKSLVRKFATFGVKVSDKVEVLEENENDKSADYKLSASKDSDTYSINVSIYEGKHTTISVKDGSGKSLVSGEGKSFASALSTIEQSDFDGTNESRKKSESIGSRIKMGIDYNMFMRMCKTAAYLEEDEDYWDALWEYYSDVGSIGDALVFFDNLFQYTSWKTAEDLWTDYSHILGDKPEGKDYEEALDAYLDENDNEVGNSAVYKYGDHYLMLH